MGQILRGMKIWGLEGIKRNECSIPFTSLKLPNKEWSFPSLLLKLSNRKKERIFLKYIYIFSIPFHSFPHLKRSGRETKMRNFFQGVAQHQYIIEIGSGKKVNIQLLQYDIKHTVFFKRNRKRKTLA